ncbi:MAG: glucose-6-phosphate isomerase [Oscillospiraceae bacterium]|nr:glucose-6-phosphate isomerase [Oscillospiraceae bacterium]
MIKVSIPQGIEVNALDRELQEAHGRLKNKTGAGKEFTGWVTLPGDYDRDEFERIQNAARKIRGESDVLVVIGIGGSYLGPRAVIELIKSSFYNSLPRNNPEIYYVGNNLSGDYIKNIISIIGDRDFSVNVISKSGTTTEPAVAFRIFRRLLVGKYGADGAAGRIYATTDKARGTLKTLSDAMGYEAFAVPDDIGGRFSALSAVGLLPIATAGIDIQELMGGAAEMMDLCSHSATPENPAFAYAAARSLLYRGGNKIEVLAYWDPDFMFMAEWWKQLYGESEGKGGKGLYPASVSFTADLHSMGQYLQDGERVLIETMLIAGNCSHSGITVNNDPEDSDGLNFLAGKTVDEINTAALQGTFLAHTDGKLPVLTVDAGGKTARDIGRLIYFFEYACGLSGYMLEVNPFDQPGVEAYKKNMFALLGKPGYEAEGGMLRARL